MSQMEMVKAFLARDSFAKGCGILLVSVSEGQAVTQMQITPAHFNAVGVVQGGAVFTLADFAFAAASNTHGSVAVGINVSITYVKAATQGTLTAKAWEVSQNPKLASYTVHVSNDQDEIVAIFQGLVYRKSAPLPL